MDNELLHRGLPKWPMMLVTGVTLPEEVAKEVIRRTDTAFRYLDWAGNDREFTERLKDLFKYEATAEWLDRWGYVDTNYVTNCWIASAFIYGPHGWCHPSGKIGFMDNVGKWPSVEAIFTDWSTLAHAFPFLNLGVTLFDRESCEEDPNKVVSIRVENGKVTLVDPDNEDVHAGHPEATRNELGVSGDDYFQQLISGHGLGMEKGLPQEWFEEWASKHVR